MIRPGPGNAEIAAHPHSPGYRPNGPCGWLKDRFGVSWQVVSPRLDVMLADPDAARRDRVMEAFLTMKKPDLAALERAFAD